MKRFDAHTHTHSSNIMFRDSTNFTEKLIDKALELDLKGIAITDHAVLSSHVDAIKHLKKLRKDGKAEDFKLGLGTEIYLVDKETINYARENNLPTKFYHLILVAKNYEGYRALAELSSNSWEEAFTFRGVMRTPSYKDYFWEWANKNKGNVIVTSACLGSEFAQLVLKFLQDQSQENREEIIKFISSLHSMFGEDFYIEIQPSHFEEQIAYNKLAIQIAEAYNIKIVINTDAHYDSKEMKDIHSIYLRSQDVERETEQFYASAYLMSVEELRSYFDYLDDERFEQYMINSLEIADKIEEFDLHRDTEVPKTTIGVEENHNPILYPSLYNIEKYPYIIKYYNSEHYVDKVLFQQIENGLREKGVTIDGTILDRLNLELEALWEVSEGLHQRMASYYLLTKEIVEEMWRVSLVGVSRGSAGAFYICYLLGITQINPINYGLDYWRHIDKNKIELADIDIDTEAGQRANILELVKEKYGHNKVLNICTFKTEGTSSAIQTMCRGMGISTGESAYISSLAVKDMTVKDCLEAYESNREARALINEMMNYDGLIENVTAIEGLICGRSVHASGVYIFSTEYWNRNAMMRTPNGQMVTQYDMLSSDYQGGLKLDFLTIEALDRIRKAFELNIEQGIYTWQGDLKSTYDKYLHPDKLDFENVEMWNKLCMGEILDAFQMDSPVGKSSVFKVKPHTFTQACDINSLMRISCEGKQPIVRYNEFKENINLWYDEMKEYGLTEDEIKIMEKHLLKNYGVASTQEQAMKLSMDKGIANFTLVEANKLRKAIAKSYAKHMIAEVHNKFIIKGLESGNREVFLNYVWDIYIVPMLGYSFSEPHIYGYTAILIQEMNLYLASALNWNVACLCVNSGDVNKDKSGSTDYGALAKAIGGMPKGFVVPPSINKADLGFKADSETQKAIYGLSAINGISAELSKEIISLRPFTSVEDFVVRCVDTKIVQPSKMLKLIKAGCFDEFNTNRVEVMVNFIKYLIPNNTKLTASNIPKLFEYNLIRQEFFNNYALYLFKGEVFAKGNCVKMYNKTQGLYKVGDIDCKYNIDVNLFLEAIEYDNNGDLCLKSKEFNKKYDVLQKEFFEWIKSQEALDLFNYQKRNAYWRSNCIGSVSKWEMESLSYYTNTHELEEINIKKYYTLSDFNTLPTEPVTYYEDSINRYGIKKSFKKLAIYPIAGVVIDKKKEKNMITVSTLEGVVDVKMSKEIFSECNKKTEEEKSYFERGTKLILVGYRREEMFVLKNYKNSPYFSEVMKLDVENGDFRLKYRTNENIF